ncbi:MAG: BlaI/MecI/CopY family transcriptional regulator [Gemmataceae bacterium]
MRDEYADVTDAELAVLRCLWDAGTQTRRDLADTLYPDGTPAHYTTVQKLLERLEAKGYVSSRRDGPRREFTAVVPREALIARRVRAVADDLCDGSLTPLLSSLVEAGPLSEDDLRELRALVRRLSRPQN